MSVSALPDSGAVAILAAAARLPGARDVEGFWANLCAGVESIRHYTPAELVALGVTPELMAHPKFVPAGALVEDVDRFDAALFGFTPREAEVLDPQHRLFFECVWEALERAGYAPGAVREPIGLFAGTSFSSYLIHNLIPQGDAIRGLGVYQAYITNDKDSLTTYVAYKLNLRGPSVTVQTACSTSLVAVQFACQSLLGFQCDLALAGGVSLQVPHVPGYVYQDGGIASPDGHCRAFDAAAAGTVGGSGVGVVVLKRLEDAIAAGDPIVAIIRGGAINNDGAAKVGYTAPSADGQAEVIALAQAIAGVGPDSIGYIEAHGTGTPLGDPIELSALTRVFRAHTDRRRFCALGSAKTNIGHLDAAAGVAGLIKAALAVQHGVVPPSLHFTRPNPESDLADGPFFVPTETIPWPIADGPRRAGVSSFGIGGTNAHVVLEEAPHAEPSGPSRDAQILCLSARSEASLDRLREDVAARLASSSDPPLADAAFTLHVGRRAWPHRLAIVCRSREEAIGQLRSSGPAVLRAQAPARGAHVAFLFPGQGTQYPGMGRGLYGRERIFRDTIDACCDRLRPLVGLDLRELIVLPAADAADAAARLNQTSLAQPALFAVEYALAQLWMSWGVRPDAMIGHSLGEWVAACLAGVMPLDAALALVAARGRLMQALPPGAMLAVSSSEADSAGLLMDGVSVAAVNGPRSVVASGPTDAIDRLAAAIESRRVACRRLETSHAFHSSMMDPALAAFAAEVARVPLSPPALAYVSNVTGTWITPEDATHPDYWVRHLRQPVRFADGLNTLAAGGTRVPLEVGPGRALAGLVRQSPGASARPAAVPSMRQRDEATADSDVLAGAVARLWLQGAPIDWPAYYQHERRRRVLMPTTPFERQRYWIDPPATAAPAAASSNIGDWLYVPTWTAAPAAGASPARGVAIVVGGADAAVDRLAGRLRADGRAVVVARSGDAFARPGPDEFTWGSEARADLARLFAGLAAEGRTPTTVCCLGGLVEDAPAAGRDARRQTFDIPLAIAQGLSDARIASPLSLVFAVNRLVDLGEPFAPERALVTGPALVIPQEYPNIACRVVDLDTRNPAEDAGWVDVLARELDAADGAPIVAYRHGERLTRTFAPARRDASHAPRLEPGGVYWITGATGGIGSAIADHLARTYGARLLLTARRAADPAFVAALDAAGAEVLAVAADVADAGAMRAARDAALSRFGRIDGVIHAAGVPGGGVIAFKTAAAAADVFAPKVEGTLVLAGLVRERPVTFIALCSSLAALQGGFGQIDYVAANAFLDAFAAWHTRASGIFTVSIDWDAWREAGMAVAVAADLHARAGGAADAGRPRALASGLATRDGLAVFERVLAGRDSQVAVSTVGLNARIAHHRQATRVVTAMAGSGAGGRAPASADGRSAEAQVAAILGARARTRRDRRGRQLLRDRRRLAERRPAGLPAQRALRPGDPRRPVLRGADRRVARRARSRSRQAGHLRDDRRRARSEPRTRAAPPRAAPRAGARMTTDNAVAVVGLAARLPGAPTVDAYWRNLRAGVESITRVHRRGTAGLRRGRAHARASALRQGQADPRRDRPVRRAALRDVRAGSGDHRPAAPDLSRAVPRGARARRVRAGAVRRHDRRLRGRRAQRLPDAQPVERRRGAADGGRPPRHRQRPGFSRHARRLQAEPARPRLQRADGVLDLARRGRTSPARTCSASSATSALAGGVVDRPADAVRLPLPGRRHDVRPTGTAGRSTPRPAAPSSATARASSS